MGQGPQALLRGGLEARLSEGGWSVETGEVDVGRDPGPDAVLAIRVARVLAQRVRAAVGAGAFPVVLSGNCNTCIGTTAGLEGPLGVVWFDAHADFDYGRSAAHDRGAFARALRRIGDPVEGIYLHVDLDVLDPGEGVANRFAAAGGLSAEELGSLVDLVFAGAAPVRAAGHHCIRS
jgi:arginase family enzyme